MYSERNSLTSRHKINLYSLWHAVKINQLPQLQNWLLTRLSKIRQNEIKLRIGRFCCIKVLCEENPSTFEILEYLTVNKLIKLSKIRCVSKKYRDWSCIYYGRNEQWMKRSFSSKYDVCPKSIDTEAVFTKTEMNNEWLLLKKIMKPISIEF